MMNRRRYPALLASFVIIAGGCTRDSRPPAQGAGAIEDIPWMWVGTVTPVDDIRPSQPERYSLRLKGGTATGRADCNTLRGTYTLEGKALRFGPLISTHMLCPPESMGDRYADYFEYIRSYFTVGDTLFMDLMADGGTLRFVRATAP